MKRRVVLTRRKFMASTAGALAAAPRLARAQGATDAPVATDKTADALFRELDDRIVAAMKRYQVPGVAVGVWWQGREHLRGFGVTNVDHPLPVDADTLFRIGSTTKTFTATAMMRLVERGVSIFGTRAQVFAGLRALRRNRRQQGDGAAADEPQRRLAGR